MVRRTRPGISRFRIRPCEPPRNDGSLFLPVDDPTLVAIELHAAERPTLIEIAHRIRLQLGLLRHRVLAEILCPAGRAIAEVVGAVVVPPGALGVGRAVEDFEMDGGMLEAYAAELHEVIGLERD